MKVSKISFSSKFSPKTPKPKNKKIHNTSIKKEALLLASSTAAISIALLAIKNGKNTTSKNPAVVFSEKLRAIFGETSIPDNLDKILKPERLSSGSTKYTYVFKTPDGVCHNIKYVVDKNNNFVHIFDRTNSITANNCEVEELIKYSENLDSVSVSKYKHSNSDYVAKSYNTKNGRYNKETYYNNKVPVSQEVTKGFLGTQKVYEWQNKQDISGDYFRVYTDYTKTPPELEIVFLDPAETKNKVVVFNNEIVSQNPKKAPVTIYHLDKTGRVINQTNDEVSDVWKQDALKVDLGKNHDIESWKEVFAADEQNYGNCYNALLLQDEYKFLKANQNITIKSDFNKLFDDIKDKNYDIEARFALMVQNTYSQEGSAFICDEIPKIFEGIEKSQIKKAIDNLMIENQLEKGVKEFILNNKKYRCSGIGGGEIGTVYKIEDLEGNSVVVKKWKNPVLMGVFQGIYTEIPTAHQLSVDKVADVPKFYMANPYTKWATIDGVAGATSGGWMMSEFIDKTTPKRVQGRGLFEWLKNHNLIHGDINSGSYVGEYIVDLGGIGRFDKGKKPLDFPYVLNSCTQRGYTISQIVKFMENN